MSSLYKNSDLPHHQHFKHKHFTPCSILQHLFFLWRDHLHDRSIFSCLLGGLTGAFFANLPVVRWFGVTPGFDTVRLGCDRTTHDAMGTVWLISRDCLNKGCSGIIGYRVRDRISNRRHLDLTASRPWICATARVNVDTGTS